MEGISIFNPLSSKYRALEDYKKLTAVQKIITVVTTLFGTIATLGIGMTPIFRMMVNRYIKIDPTDTTALTTTKEAPPLDPNALTPEPAMIEASKEEVQNTAFLSSLLNKINAKRPEALAACDAPTLQITEEELEFAEQIKEADEREIVEYEKSIREEEEELKKENLTDSFSLSRILKTPEKEDSGLQGNLNFVPFIADVFTHKENYAMIAFKEGKIVPTQDLQEAKEARKQFSVYLKETYGTVLTNTALKRYLLSEKETLGLIDVKRTLVKIAMNVRKSDLERLFKTMQREDENLPSYRARESLRTLNSELYNQIKEKQHFAELTSEEVAFIASAFSLGAKFETLKGKKEEDYFFWHDLKFLKQKKYWNSLDKQFPLLSTGEYLAKGIGYIELKKDMVIPMPEHQFYKVHSSLQNKNDAVIAHILNPLNESQENTETAYLIFRGTNLDPGALAGQQSLARDLEQGIGDATYAAREAEVQTLVENYLKSSQKESVTLHITAHSLGGCDAQRATVSILEKVASALEDSPWKKLKNLIITTHNSPGPNNEVNQRLKTTVRDIQNKNIKIDVDLKHVRYFDGTKEDPLQMQGDTLIGADLANDGISGEPFQEASSFFKREIIRITMNDENTSKSRTVAHSYRNFYTSHKTVTNRETKTRMTYTIEKITPEQCKKEFERVCIGDRTFDDKEMSRYNRTYWGTVDYVRSGAKATLQPVVKFFHDVAMAYDDWKNGPAKAVHEKRRVADQEAQDEYNVQLEKLRNQISTYI